MEKLRAELERDRRLRDLWLSGKPMPRGWTLPPLGGPPIVTDPEALAASRADLEKLKSAEFEFEGDPWSGRVARLRWDELGERAKLEAMEHWVDWSRVNPRDRAEAMLAQFGPGGPSPETGDYLLREADRVADSAAADRLAARAAGGLDKGRAPDLDLEF